jgi:polyene glycosyltransferase
VDCYDQAVRAQDLGIGLRLDHPRRLDPDDVEDKVRRVLDEPSFRQRAEDTARLQAAAGGRTAAADLLLGLPELAAAPAPHPVS